MGIPLHHLSGRARAYVAEAEARKRQLSARPPGTPIEPPAPAAAAGPTLKTIMKRAAAGAYARENGERFEGDCLASARAAGVMLWKIPSGCKWIGPRRIRPEKTPFDFCGAIPALGGRGMCFDAKAFLPESASSLPVNYEDGSGVKPHQVIALREQGAGRWISGVIVQCGPRGDVRWMDWRFLKTGKPYRIAWDDPTWFPISPLSCPIDFDRLIRAYGGGGDVA